MKFLLLMQLIAVSLFAQTNQISRSYEWQTPEMKFELKNGYVHLISSEMNSLFGAVGEPMLLAQVITYAIPENYVLSDVKVDIAWQRSESQNITLFPMQEPHQLDALPKFTEPDPIAYATEKFPRQNYEVLPVSVASGISLVSIRLIPFSASPKNRTIRTAEKITVSISFKKDETAPQNRKRYSPRLRKIVASQVVNPADVAMTETKSGLQVSSVAETVDYVVISPADYLPYWEKYILARKSKFPDLTFRVKNFSEIETEYANYVYENTTLSPRNSAERIHAYIKDMAEQHGTQYVLLGGPVLTETARKDGNSRFLTSQNALPTGVTRGCDNAGDVPSDMYFACLDRASAAEFPYPWDGNGDGILVFGETYGNDISTRTIDLIPDISVSRITALPYDFHTGKIAGVEEIIDGYISKLERAETSNYSGTFKNVILGSSLNDARYSKSASEFIRSETEFYDGQLNVFDSRHPETTIDAEWAMRKRGMEFQSKNFPVVSAKSLFEFGTPVTSGEYTAEINNILNSDWEMILANGHGERTGTCGLNVSGVHSTSGLTKFEIVIKSCSTGHFDYESFGWASPSLGETVVNNINGGALVSWNLTRLGWGYYNDDAHNKSLSGKMERLVLEALYTDRVENAGMAWLIASGRFANGLNGINGDRNVECLIETVQFGDPLVAISETPNLIYAGTDNVWNLNSSAWQRQNSTLKQNYQHSNYVEISGTAELNIQDAVSAVDVKINRESSDLFKFTGTKPLRIMNGLTVSKGGLEFNVEGGVGQAGIVFEEKGNLILSGNKSRYIGGVKNAEAILVNGEGAVLDFAETEFVEFDKLTYENAIGVIRGRRKNQLLNLPAIDLANSTLYVQTLNSGLSVNAMNSTIQFEQNPLLLIDSLSGTSTLENSTIKCNESGWLWSDGLKIISRGNSTIESENSVDLRGNVNLNVQMGTLDFSLTSTNGVIVKSGSGKLNVNKSLEKSEMFIAENGVIDFFAPACDLKIGENTVVTFDASKSAFKNNAQISDLSSNSAGRLNLVGSVIIAGENNYSGGTVLTNAQVVAETKMSLGFGGIIMKNSTLTLNGNGLSNAYLENDVSGILRIAGVNPDSALNLINVANDFQFPKENFAIELYDTNNQLISNVNANLKLANGILAYVPNSSVAENSTYVANLSGVKKWSEIVWTDSLGNPVENIDWNSFAGTVKVIAHDDAVLLIDVTLLGGISFFAEGRGSLTIDDDGSDKYRMFSELDFSAMKKTILNSTVLAYDSESTLISGTEFYIRADNSISLKISKLSNVVIGGLENHLAWGGKIENNGTLLFQDKIALQADFIGLNVIQLAADSELKLTIPGSFTAEFSVIGNGASSLVKPKNQFTETSNFSWSPATNLKFRNLTVNPLQNFICNDENIFDSTVNLTLTKNMTLKSENMHLVIGSLSGNGNILSNAAGQIIELHQNTETAYDGICETDMKIFGNGLTIASASENNLTIEKTGFLNLIGSVNSVKIAGGVLQTQMNRLPVLHSQSFGTFHVVATQDDTTSGILSIAKLLTPNVLPENLMVVLSKELKEIKIKSIFADEEFLKIEINNSPGLRFRLH